MPVEKIGAPPRATQAMPAKPKKFPLGNDDTGGRVSPHSGHVAGTSTWPYLRWIARVNAVGIGDILAGVSR